MFALWQLSLCLPHVLHFIGKLKQKPPESCQSDVKKLLKIHQNVIVKCQWYDTHYCKREVTSVSFLKSKRSKPAVK